MFVVMTAVRLLSGPESWGSAADWAAAGASVLVVLVTLELATAERRNIEARRAAERLSLLDAVQDVVQAVTRHNAVIRNAAKNRDHGHIQQITVSEFRHNDEALNGLFSMPPTQWPTAELYRRAFQVSLQRDHLIRAMGELSTQERLSKADWDEFDRALRRSADAEQKFTEALAAARA
ncbi:hypothetical protein P7B02_12755 [Caulobacter segnis]|uniref:hypothetical protein n=1 Tax=Caulobacter segnis TaxID=88688 RepID=UPI0024109740|nr:hypothetical protein [Caulobacter segnis]MDG2522415.1 hypothetical protein [Caulobacter segnis]